MWRCDCEDKIPKRCSTIKSHGLRLKYVWIYFSKGAYHKFWVSQTPMILFLGHGPRPRTNPNAAGGVALGWVPLDFIFALCLPFLYWEHTSLVFGYVWIEYLIDFGENKIQGSQACRILLGCMVGIYWIYALFGGSLLFGQKRMQPEHATKKKKLWIVITWLHHSASIFEIHIEKLGLDMFGLNIW